MNSERSNPPRFGIWLLRHISDKETLTGDLIEMYCERRTCS
jgi:hypothetical protein